MTPPLTPAYSLTLGSQRWTEQALSISVELNPAPLLDVLTVRLPATAPLGAAVGDPTILALDGGEGESDVFTGRVDAIRRGVRELEVTALDAGGALAAYRPAATYEQATIGTLIGTLCSDVGVETGDVDDGPTLAFYAADPGRTALEHVARLAGWTGALARVSADGKLDASVVNGAQPDVALRYGREPLALDGAERAAPVESFVVAGEAGAGTASQPEALRPTSDFFGGSRPDGPSATAVWRWEPALRTADAAQTASAALTRIYRSGRRRGTLKAWLQPPLRPGTVVEIQDVPDGVDGGPFWIDRVRHRLSPSGARTEAGLWQGGDAFDPSSLLGSAAGALAGAF